MGGVLACGVAKAGTSDAWMAAEASMRVTGTVEVTPDGHVQAYAVDQPEKLPPAVIEVIQKNVPRWTFNFSAAPTSVLKTKMSMRIVARAIDDKQTTISIAGASFGDDGSASGDTVSYKTRFHPLVGPRTHSI